MDVRTVILEPESARARLVVFALEVLGSIARPFGFKGFWRAARFLGRFVDKDQACIVGWGEDSRFRFLLADPYWSRIVCGAFSYEPEIEFILKRMGTRAFAFLDCGANFGYWSVFCSAPEIGCQAVVAVEASASTFRELERNCNLNSKRFELRHNAIYSVDGRIVSLKERDGNHAATSILENGGNGFSVQTVTIDSLLFDGFLPSDLPVIVKLDVEGVEIDALKGAKELFQRDALIIYEDHGNDPASAVTDFIVEELGLLVFFVDDALTVHRIGSAAAARGVKRKPERGYNFFAVTPESSFESQFHALAA